MKMSRLELKSAMQNMHSANKKSTAKYSEKIVKTVNQALVQQRNELDYSKWFSHLDNINDIFYEALTEVYSYTSSKLRGFYPDLKKFEIKDIFQITYKNDGKTLEERIESYWDEGYSQLQDNYPEEEIKHYLCSYYDRLIQNEAAVVESAIKENKIPLKATIKVIDGGCDCGRCECDEYIGEYAADEDIDLPPYHPGCDCIWWYEETDDIDDIEDLELDIDEVGPVEIEVEE